MKTDQKTIVASIATFLAATSANSFELVTHGAITNQAYSASQLSQSSDLLKRLGLVDLNSPFGDKYYDFTNGQTNKRSANAYEADKMPEKGKDISLRVRGWLMRGAIREDDLSSAGAVAAREGQPFLSDPDPRGNINRVCNHFFNPITRFPLIATGLTLANMACPNVNVTAPNWAIGTAAAFASNPPSDDNFRNHFSIFSARESMWRALTLTSKDGGAAPRADSDTGENARKAYWATVFRSIGDAVHLVQDMAQPQHTRDEPHGTPGEAVSLEKYLDARAQGKSSFRFDGQTITAQALPPLPISSGYPIPRFDRYSDYWSTASGMGSINSGAGLADYSSRGFFTPNQSLGDVTNNFPSPSNSLGAYTISIFDRPSGQPCPGPTVGRIEYAWGSVPDSIVAGPSAPIRMASRTLIGSRWAISRCVMDDQASLLIPRAVAYSAGLIDYFFRGQLEVTPPDEGIYSLVDHYDFAGEGQTPTSQSQGFKGFKTIKLKLRNVTPDIAISGGGTSVQDMVSGKVVAVLKFRRNNNYNDDLSGEPTDANSYKNSRSEYEEIVVSDRVKDEMGQAVTTITLNAASSTPAKLLYFEFDKELPINATDVYLQVVYRGNLGREDDAVVVQTVDISEPTYFAYMNASDYIRIQNKVYTRDEINGSGVPPMSTLTGSQLRALVRPRSCINTTTDQLSESCFQPFAVNYPLIIGGGSPYTSVTIDLPEPRTYLRMAMLTPRGASAMLNPSASNCVPRNVFPLPGRNVQTDYSEDADGTLRIKTVVDVIEPRKIRDVYGYTLPCVQLGDGSNPNAPTDDNRNDKMTPLSGTNLKPKQIQNFKFGAP